MRAERLQRAAVGRPSVGVGKKSEGDREIACWRAAASTSGLCSSGIEPLSFQLLTVE